ncbi:RHS repeat-associated core domain-containing protein, partial [Ralstonia pseudosolanacearum]
RDGDDGKSDQPAETTGSLIYARNHLGSVTDTLTPNGRAVTHSEYGPYGELVKSQGRAEYRADFGYAGMQYHAASGMYLTLFRAYDSGTGRWVSRDPIGERGGFNLYGYVSANPISYNDPKGLWVNIVGGAAIGALGNLGYQLWNNGGRFECVDWGDVGTWAMLGGLSGVLVPEGLMARGGMQTVTRWGPSGNWVMTGGSSWRNWLLAGGPELGYPMSSAVTTQLPASSLAWPAGWEVIKGVIGQRVIVGGAAIGGASAANAATGADNSCGCKK